MANSEAVLTLVIKARNLANAEVAKLGGAFDTAGKAVGRFKGALIALGKLGVLAVITAFVTAIGVLAESTKKAEAEEVSIKKLDAALKQNAKTRDADRAAIEKTITSREKLAFSDSDLRESLGLLVIATGDVSRALDLQNTAMDLARLKNIPLVDATKLLNTALAGNARGLKDIGIELGKDATKVDILRAIQKKAAGQAESYASTNKAALEIWQIKLDDLQEELGKAFLPLIGKIARFLVDNVIPAIEDIGHKIDIWLKRNRSLVNAIIGFAGGALGLLVTVLGKVADALGVVGGWVGWLADRVRTLFSLVRVAVAELQKLADLNKAPEHPVDLGGRGGKTQKARGGFAGGRVLVGERGVPEIVNLPGGSFVTPMSRGGGNGGPQTIILQISGEEVGRVIVPAVSRSMYYELQRAAPTLLKT